MAEHTPKMQHFNIFLLRDSCRKIEGSLRSPRLISEFLMTKKKGFEAGLYLPKPPAKEPVWVQFLREGFGDGVSVQTNRLSSALLLIRVRGRVFAFTFGHTRSLLKEELFEFDFGLMVAVNRVDAQRIRSISLRMFREMTLKRSEEASRGTDLGSFDVNRRQDLLRGVTGRPRDSRFATRVSGADSLVVDLPLRFADLGKKCEEMLAAFKEKEYLQQGFRWIGNIKEVREPKTLLILNDGLVNALRSKSPDVQMIIPDSLTRDAIRGFLYPGEKDEDSVHAELEIVEWYKSSEARLDELKSEGLKNKLIRVLDANGGVDGIQEFQFFSYEAQVRGTSYVLNNGRWYQVARSLLKEIDEFIAQLPSHAMSLIPAKKGEIEDHYVARLVKGKKSLVSMHKATVRLPGGSMEICDVLSKEGHLIHIKRWSASATFSHLLRQGETSAEAIRSIPSVRKHIREHIQKFGKDALRLFPVKQFSTGKLSVVFALIRESENELPFFSKLSLMREAQQIESLGFKVIYQRIEVI